MKNITIYNETQTLWSHVKKTQSYLFIKLNKNNFRLANKLLYLFPKKTYNLLLSKINENPRINVAHFCMRLGDSKSPESTLVF